MKLKLIHNKVPAGKLSFTCTWCGGTFLDKAQLEKHWVLSQSCNNNRNASNPTVTKYGGFGVIQTQPGEPMLNRIRAKDCLHPAGDLQWLSVDPDGGLVYQCNNCYSEVRIAK